MYFQVLKGFFGFTFWFQLHSTTIYHFNSVTHLVYWAIQQGRIRPNHGSYGATNMIAIHPAILHYRQTKNREHTQKR